MGCLRLPLGNALRLASAIDPDNGNAVVRYGCVVSAHEPIGLISRIEPLGSADRTGNGFQGSEKRAISKPDYEFHWRLLVVFCAKFAQLPSPIIVDSFTNYCNKKQIFDAAALFLK